MRTLLQRAFDSRRSVDPPPWPLTSQSLWEWLAGPPSKAGVAVTETSSLRMGAVYRSVSLISGTIAALPLKAFRDRGDGRETVSAQILEQPYPNLTQFEWVEQMLVWLLGWGNSYYWLIRNDLGTQILRLLPLQPWTVGVRKDKGTPLNPSGLYYRIEGVAQEMTPYEILAIPGLGYDGIVGLSVIRQAREAIGLGVAAEEFGSRFFANGSLLGGVLSTDQEVGKEAAETLKQRWRDKFAGIAHAHEVAILDRGAQYTRIGIPQAESQYLETRQFSVQEIARFFGIPPHLLMDVSGSTSWGSGLEEQSNAFVRYTLRPWLSRIEQRLSAQLLPRGQECKFVTDDLVRGDMLQRYQAYALGVSGGWLTAPDIRELENLPPLPQTGAGGAPTGPPVTTTGANQQ